VFFLIEPLAMKRLTRLALLPFCWLALSVAPTLAEVPTLPAAEIDPAAGFMDGVRFIGSWPARSAIDKRPGDPSGFEVHLVPRDDRDRALVYPAGSWFKPPEGTYLFWLEGKNLMSPFLGVLTYQVASAPASGQAAVAPVVAAGRIKHSPDVGLDSTTSLRLLHLESHLSDQGRVRPQMTRRAIASEALRGVAMPAGKVVAALWNRQTEKYTALEVVTVPYAQTVEVSPRPPAQGSGAVYIVLEPPRGVRWQEEGMSVGLKAADGTLVAADEVAQTLYRTFAIWLAVPGGELELALQSDEMKLSKAVRFRLDSGLVFDETVSLVAASGR
jgi:hypothetical protein